MTNPYFYQLQHVANSINPLLLLISISMVLLAKGIHRYRRATTLVAITAVVYGFMFADKILNLWGSFGGDYSTHTAAAIGLAYFISRYATSNYAKYSVWLVFLMYCGLMMFQRYHTALDIASTAFVVSIFMAPIVYLNWNALLSTLKSKNT